MNCLGKYEKIIWLFVICMISAAAFSAESELTGLKGATLDQLVIELKRNNPMIRAVALDWEASKKRIWPARSLDDPRVGYSIMNIPTGNPSLSRTPMSGQQIDVRQKIPFPGKRSLKKKIARIESNQQNQDSKEATNEIITRFKHTYYDYGYTLKAIMILKNTKARLSALTRTLEANYASGSAFQQDVLKNKLEEGKVADRLARLESTKRRLKSRLLTMLNRETSDSLNFTVSFPKSHKLEKSVDEFVEVAVAHRPWIEKMDLEVQRKEFQTKLSKRDLLPDADFMFGYRFRNNVPGGPVSGENFMTGGVTINVPLWAPWKQGHKITEAKRLEKSSEYKKESVLQEVRYQVETAYYDIKQLEDQIALYQRHILPQAKAATASSQRSFEVDQVDFLNLITSELSFLDHQIMMIKYKADYAKALASLDMVTGQIGDQS